MLSFRLTPEEYEQLHAVASVSGLGLPTFVRRAAFSSALLSVPAYEARQPNLVKADLAKIIGQLGRIASSANQLAKVANSTGTPLQAMSIIELQKELAAIRTHVVRLAK